MATMLFEPRRQELRPLRGVFLFGILSTTACAGVHPGYFAELEVGSAMFQPVDPEHADLVMSGREREGASSELFGVVDATLENKSNDFMTVEVSSLSFDPSVGKGASAPMGADLTAWIEGASNAARLSAINRAWARSALAGVGALAAVGGAVGGDRRVARAGVATIHLAESLEDLETLEAMKQAAENEGTYPARHLLSGPITIGPHQFVRRWFLLFTKAPNATHFVDRVHLDVKTTQGRTVTTRRYILPFREVARSHSQWQSEASSEARRVILYNEREPNG